VKTLVVSRRGHAFSAEKDRRATTGSVQGQFIRNASPGRIISLELGFYLCSAAAKRNISCLSKSNVHK
jgi:hypothetical protein